MDDNNKIVKITKIKKPQSKIDEEMMNNITKELHRDLNLEKDKNIIKNLPNQINKKFTVNSLIQNNSGNKKVSDSDFLTTITKRLNLVEKELKESNTKIKELSIQNEKLNEKLKSKILNEKLNENLSLQDNCKNCSKLKSHIKDLNSYIKELKEFIIEKGYVLLNSTPELDNDNRLEYLNTQIKKISEDLNIPEEEFEEDSELNQIERKLPDEIDINIISRRIEEMNALIYKDNNYSKFEMDDNKIFKLKQRKEIKIYFYKNGLIIEGYKFYEFVQIEAKRILHDILDGYTPYILKTAFPDGAVLQIVNNLHKDYEQNNNNFTSTDQPKVKKDLMNGEDFLKIFPEKVIRNGKVFNIREDMEKFIVNKTNNEYNLEKEEHYINLDKDNLNMENISKLKIKLNIVDKIITININKQEKIKTVYEYLKNLINSKLKIDKFENFILYSNYPYTSYDKDDNKSLEELKLFPSHFLILDEKK